MKSLSHIILLFLLVAGLWISVYINHEQTKSIRELKLRVESLESRLSHNQSEIVGMRGLVYTKNMDSLSRDIKLALHMKRLSNATLRIIRSTKEEE